MKKIMALAAVAAFLTSPVLADTDLASSKNKDDGVVVGIDGKPQVADVDDTVGDKESEKPSEAGNAVDGYGWEKHDS